MVIGPEQTPYEDALFTFDIYLPADYPHKPPVLYYHSYTTDRLNPNLYVDGKVCGWWFSVEIHFTVDIISIYRVVQKNCTTFNKP